jgi:hypothetical protein
VAEEPSSRTADERSSQTPLAIWTGYAAGALVGTAAVVRIGRLVGVCLCGSVGRLRLALLRVGRSSVLRIWSRRVGGRMSSVVWLIGVLALRWIASLLLRVVRSWRILVLALTLRRVLLLLAVGSLLVVLRLASVIIVARHVYDVEL